MTAVRSLRLLVLRRLRRGPLRAVTTVLVIAAGVSLAASVSVVVTSVDRSIEDFGRSLAGPAPLRVTGATFRGGLPNDVVSRIDDVEGVAAAVPMVQVVSRVQPTGGGSLERALVFGVDCRVEALFGSFGCDPAALAASVGPVAVGPAHAGRDDWELRTDAGVLPLGDAPVVETIGELADGQVVLVPLHVAQAQFTRPDQVDVAYVLVADGFDVGTVRDRLERAVGEQFTVLAGTDPPNGSDNVLGPGIALYGILGVFALGIGAVLVSNTASLSLETRRRELAVLGALGARQRTIAGTTVVEMALLGAAGGLLGGLGGVVVASPIVASLSSFTEEVAGIALSTHASPSVLLLAVVVGTLLGGGAALAPARRAMRIDVAAELSGRDPADTAKPPRLGRRVAAWSMVALLGVVATWVAQRDGGLEPWQAAVVQPAFLFVIVGSLFAGAAAAPLVVGWLGSLTDRSSSAPLRLAVGAARRDHRRTGLLAITVSAAVATAFITEGSSTSARASIEASFARNGEGVDVATTPPDEGYGPNVPPGLVAEVADVPGVAEVNEGIFVIAGGEGDQVLVHSATGNRLVIDVIEGVADPDRLAAGEVLIGAGLARRQGVRAGDDVVLSTPGGDVELAVMGVWEDGSFVGSNVTMAPDLLTRLYGPQPAAFVGLRPAPGISEADLARRIDAAGLHPDLTTRLSGQVADDIADEVDAQFESFRVLQRALLAVLFVAVMSSLLLAAVQRRRELGLLGAVGADPPIIARLLLVEAGVVAVTGVALSFIAGPLAMFALNQALPFVVGFRNPLRLEWGVLLVSGAIALVVVLAGAAWPARRAARVEVLEALRYE